MISDKNKEASPPPGKRAPSIDAQRLARVLRIKAHIKAMPGIPMCIASEAVE